MYDPQWDLPVLSTTSQNGGRDWSNYSFSHKLGLIYFPYGVNPVAHWRGAGGNGQRAIGQYQTGGILALDAATEHRAVDATISAPTWATARARSRRRATWCSSGRSTATSWRWTRRRQGAVALPDRLRHRRRPDHLHDRRRAVRRGVRRRRRRIPYGDSVTQGDSLWAFKLGGTYKTASGSSEAPTPLRSRFAGPCSGRPVEGSTVNNTVLPRAQIADHGHRRRPRQHLTAAPWRRRTCACRWARP